MPTAIPISAIILDTLLKATLLLALAWGAAAILKKRSAATRHMVRSITLAALLALPFLVIFMPAWQVKGLPGFARNKRSSSTRSSVAVARPSANVAGTVVMASRPSAPVMNPPAQPPTRRVQALNKSEHSEQTVAT